MITYACWSTVKTKLLGSKCAAVSQLLDVLRARMAKQSLASGLAVCLRDFPYGSSRRAALIIPALQTREVADDRTESTKSF